VVVVVGGLVVVVEVVVVVVVVGFIHRELVVVFAAVENVKECVV
jgi:hypothetical protein